MIKVCKFGGSSLADSEQFKKIKEIVQSDSQRKVIVVSACGKAFKDDHKVTDLLYLCIAHRRFGMSYDDIIKLIANKHQTIIDELNLDYDLKKDIENIQRLLLSNSNEDELISRGEYISSRLLAKYIDGEFVDAKDVICFNYDGSLNIELTKEKFLPYLKKDKKIVVPGFYGAFNNGVIKTMSRGGSDISGALLANVCDAKVYENFTDVSGIYVCDPRIIDNPKQISILTYDELREMSYMGANVLHDEAILPAKIKDIPINIRNTNEIDNAGTMIVSNIENETTNPITGITGKKGFSVITISKSNSSSEIGFLRKILEIFEHYHILTILVTTGIDSFSIIIENKASNNIIYEVINELKDKLQLENISLKDGLALVCVVGRGMKAKKGMSGKIFSTLGENNINIKTISQGADEISIIMGVDEDDFETTIKTIYRRFVA